MLSMCLATLLLLSRFNETPVSASAGLRTDLLSIHHSTILPAQHQLSDIKNCWKVIFFLASELVYMEMSQSRILWIGKSSS